MKIIRGGKIRPFKYFMIPILLENLFQLLQCDVLVLPKKDEILFGFSLLVINGKMIGF